MNKKAIKRLMYLRSQLENRIDNYISDYLLRDKEVKTEEIKDSLEYVIDENLGYLNREDGEE